MVTQPWRVLVADDDADMRALIATILRGGAYDVVLCQDAESALERIQGDQPFDAIICDFMLPGMSGLDLIEQLRADPRTASVPVLMISAHTDPAMGQRAKTAGANAFLNKPFTLVQLRNTLADLLTGKGERAVTCR